MPRLAHVNHQVFCVWCGGPVPEDRARRRASTCSKEHAKERKNYLRQRTELRRCRYCMQPCTPEEQADFRQWRRERNRQLTTASADRSALEVITLTPDGVSAS